MLNSNLQIDQIDPRDPEVVAGIEECWIDSRKFAKRFYPDRFSLGFSVQHDKLFAAIDARNSDGTPKHKKIVVKGSRGIGKTTIAKTIVAKAIRYQDHNLIPYIGKSHDWAAIQTEAIKHSLLMDRLGNKVFGSIRTKVANTDVQETFSKKAWVAVGVAKDTQEGDIETYGCMVVPRGAGQPVRGLLFDWEMFSYRPTLFIIDDLEDKKLIDSESYRQETYEWVLSDVVEAKPPDEMTQNFQFLYIDTLKHEDAVLQRIFDLEDWYSLELPICDESYNSLVPSFISTEKILEEVKRHKSNIPSTLDIFAQEKMCLPIAKEGASFSKDYFQYYSEGDREFQDQLHGCATGIIYDPAKTAKASSAESGFIVFSVNLFTHRIYIRLAQGLRLHPEEQYAKLFELATAYGARAIGYEKNSLDEFISYPLTNAMLQAGFNFELVELKPRTSGSSSDEFSGRMGAKKARIASLIPFYRKGLIYHNEIGTGALETQLLSYPKSKLWDVMDAAAYIVQMLDRGHMFMLPEEYIDEDGVYDIEKEYEDLVDEPAEMGDYGII